MRTNVSNRMALLGMAALSACAGPTDRVPAAGAPAAQALVAQGVQAPRRVTLSTEMPSNDLGGTAPGKVRDASEPRYLDGRLNYEALRAKYGEPNSRLKINPRALDISQQPGFDQVKVEQQQLRFPASAKWAASKTAGDILACGTECGPHGLIRKVTAVVKEGDEVIVKTIPASVTDLITDGWLHVESPEVAIGPLGIENDGLPTDRILHHPHGWWATSTGQLSPMTWWPLNWQGSGSGVTGAPFQAATDLNYFYSFDLTESNSVVETLSFVNTTAADFALSTATTKTVAVSTNTSVNTQTFGAVCEDCTWGVCYCGLVSDFGGNGYENGAANGWTVTTTTTNVVTTCSDQLTPTPLASPFNPADGYPDGGIGSEVSLPATTSLPFPPQAPLFPTQNCPSSQPPAGSAPLCDSNCTYVTVNQNDNGEYPANPTSTSTSSLTEVTTAPDMVTGTDSDSKVPIQYAPGTASNLTKLAPVVFNIGDIPVPVVIQAELTQNMTPTISYNGPTDIQGTVFYNSIAQTGFSYVSYGSSPGFSIVGTENHEFGPPAAQAVFKPLTSVSLGQSCDPASCASNPAGCACGYATAPTTANPAGVPNPCIPTSTGVSPTTSGGGGSTPTCEGNPCSSSGDCCSATTCVIPPGESGICAADNGPGQCGTPGVDFAATMDYDIGMKLWLGGQNYTPSVDRTYKGEIKTIFQGGLPNNLAQVSCATNNDEEMVVQATVTGPINFLANIDQNVFLQSVQSDYVVPVPAQQCPACTYDPQCSEVGAGYTCKTAGGSQCDGAAGCFCQPDGTLCTKGSCGGDGDCGPEIALHSTVQCIAVPLPQPYGTEKCCDGTTTIQNACASGHSCMYGANGAGNADCPAGNFCTAQNCCEQSQCPQPGGFGPNCPSGYTNNSATGCCLPAACTVGTCGACNEGTACDWKSPEFCCQTSSCQYAVCNSDSDCAVTLGSSSQNFTIPLTTCTNGCCQPANACDTGALCVNLTPAESVSSSPPYASACPGGGSEFQCSPHTNLAPSDSPWCCECNSGSTCLNGHTCPGGDYCDAVGCCYPCGNSGTVDPLGNGAACHPTGTEAQGLFTGKNSGPIACGVAVPQGTYGTYTIPAQGGENQHCPISCASGIMSQVSVEYATNCNPISCPGAAGANGCDGTDSCSITVNNTVCGQDPCVGTPKAATITVSCVDACPTVLPPDAGKTFYCK